MSATTKHRRVQETFTAALEINGATKENTQPAVVGIVEALSTKFSKDAVVSAVSNKKKLAKHITSSVHKDGCAEYETSQENMLRSVAVYYSMGVMGKRKYIKVRHSLSYKNVFSKWKKTTRIKISNCSIPALVPYYKLATFMEEINIGTLHSVQENLCGDSGDKINGFFRDLKDYLPQLAEFYLKVYKEVDFNWFGKPFTFKVAIGGDGAPFGKNDQSCAWLVSFLNVGKRFLSNEDNFLIFGANCSESCVPVEKYVAKLVSDITYLENNVFKVNDKNVKFEFSELPNDMKMLCFLGGELSNSAKYFSSFANVSYDNMSNLQFEFAGQGKHQWTPWVYKKRLSVAKQVVDLKKKIVKSKLSKNTQRNKITSYIAEKQSRQEYCPRIGKLIDKAHVEPLHLKNNTCALMFRHILEFAIAKSNLASNVNDFSSVNPQSPFSKLISNMRYESNLSRLAKKVIKWFNETKANSKSFDYRFTGHESRRFLHNFMYLISAIEELNDSTPARLKLHVLAFTTLSLRNAVSLFNRFNIEEEQLHELDKACNDFYSCCSLFLQVNPSVWTLGRVVPVHARDIFNKYGKGLIINSMEGREAKHQAVSRYAQNSTYYNRWHSVFRHEFISLIWLRERGCNLPSTKACNATYIPKRVTGSDYCYCGLMFTEGVCRYCNHDNRTMITNSIEQKSVQFK